MINRSPIQISAPGPADPAKLHTLLADPHRLSDWCSLAKRVLTITGDTLEVETDGGRQWILYSYNPEGAYLTLRTKPGVFPQEFTFRFKPEGKTVRIDAEVHPGGEVTDEGRQAIKRAVDQDLGRLVEKTRS